MSGKGRSRKEVWQAKVALSDVRGEPIRMQKTVHAGKQAGWHKEYKMLQTKTGSAVYT
jgi:hypothetical protein